MMDLYRKPLKSHLNAKGSEDLDIVLSPASAHAEFSSLVTRVLHCRTFSLVLFESNGDLIVNDNVGQATGAVAKTSQMTADRAAHAGALLRFRKTDCGDRYGCPPSTAGLDATWVSISLPLVLPGGITGAVTVADREDGAPFGAADRDLLEHLTTFYTSTFATPALLEALRLRGDMRTLRKQAIQAQESDRQRLARELHDDVGHSLTTAILSIDMTARHVPVNGIAAGALASARDSLKECVDHLNEFAFQLRPRVLNDLGLAPALRGLARRVGESGALSAVVVVHRPERRLSDETELAAFRISQEALTNALKHAEATHIIIDLTFAKACLEVKICDDGAGFDLATVPFDRRHRGQGLLGMRERAELVGGTLEIQTKKGSGTSVRARLPFEGERS